MKQHEIQSRSGGIQLPKVFGEAHFIADAHADFQAVNFKYAGFISGNEIISIPAPEGALVIKKFFPIRTEDCRTVEAVILLRDPEGTDGP